MSVGSVVVDRSLFKTILLGPVILIFFSGCFWHRVDYSVFDPRCREWIKNRNYNMAYSKEIESMSDVRLKFSYYMCVNMVSGHMVVPERIFYDDPKESVAVLVDGLSKYNEDIAVWMIIHALQQIQLKGDYHVAEDDRAMSAIKVRMSMMKNEEWKDMASGKLKWIESQKKN